MRYEWFIARRYLRPQGGSTFIFHLIIISTIGVALGVASLITVLSVMNGFGNYLRKTMIQVGSHIIIEYPGGTTQSNALIQEFEKVSNVAACAPMIRDFGIIDRTDYPREGPLNVVQFMGIDPHRESAVSGLKDSLIAGSLDDLQSETRPEESEQPVKLTDLVQHRMGDTKLPGIIIGKEMANNLYGVDEVDDASNEETYRGVIGKRLTLIAFPWGDNSGGMEKPVQKTFVIEGVFKTGHYDYDSTLVYISLLSAQVVLEIPDQKVLFIQVRLKDYSKESTQKTCMDIYNRSSDLGYPGYIQTWMGMNQIFFHALDIEKRTMNYILNIIILVATFNIIATLFMVVTEKTRDIGLLRAIGAGRRNVMIIFIFLGLIVGALGAIFGVGGGLSLCMIIKIFPLPMPGDGQVYYLKNLPCDMEIIDFLWVGLYTMVVSFLASIYPAIRASRLIPVEALRFS